MHVFGIGRISSALYILAMAFTFFLYVKRVAGRREAL
jgi:hypothetical protein